MKMEITTNSNEKKNTKKPETVAVYFKITKELSQFVDALQSDMKEKTGVTTLTKTNILNAIFKMGIRDFLVKNELTEALTAYDEVNGFS